jgi:hypoxanthine phosphoribosyltransferase
LVTDIHATFPPILTETQIAERVHGMAREISESYGPGPITILSLLKGSFIFTADLARALAVYDHRLRIEFITASSYGDKTQSSGEVRLRWEGELPWQNERVLIIDDILDTGFTISHVRELTMNQKPDICKVAVLLDKPVRRKVPVTADFTGFSIDDYFVVGYGLDYAEHFRELPYLAILPTEYRS